MISMNLDNLAKAQEPLVKLIPRRTQFTISWLCLLCAFALPGFSQGLKISQYPNTNQLGSNDLFITAHPGSPGTNFNISYGQLSKQLISSNSLSLTWTQDIGTVDTSIHTTTNIPVTSIVEGTNALNNGIGLTVNLIHNGTIPFTGTFMDAVAVENKLPPNSSPMIGVYAITDFPNDGINATNGDGIGINGVSSGLYTGLIGVGGDATSSLAGQTNVAMRGRAAIASGSTSVGTYGAVMSLASYLATRPSYVSAAGLFDNWDTGLPVFIARTNQVEVGRVRGDGTLQFNQMLASNSMSPISGAQVIFNQNNNFGLRSIGKFNAGSVTNAEFVAVHGVGNGSYGKQYGVAGFSRWNYNAQTNIGVAGVVLVPGLGAPGQSVGMYALAMSDTNVDPIEINSVILGDNYTDPTTSIPLLTLRASDALDGPPIKRFAIDPVGSLEYMYSNRFHFLTPSGTLSYTMQWPSFLGPPQGVLCDQDGSGFLIWTNRPGLNGIHITNVATTNIVGLISTNILGDNSGPDFSGAILSQKVVGGNGRPRWTFDISANTNLPLTGLAQSGANSGQVAEWNGTAWVAADVQGVTIPNTFTPTNFVLNTVYTNTSGSIQLVSASVALTTAAVTGDASMDFMVDQAGAATFKSESPVAISTTAAVTLAQKYTNFMACIISNNATYYFSNSSSGSGNVASIVPGTGKVTTLSDGAAAGVATLAGNNTFTGNNSFVSVTATTFNGGASGLTNFVFPALTKTANYTLLITDSGTCINNNGASGTVTNTLPASSAGLYYNFVIATAQNVTVKAVGSDTIRLGATVSAAAGIITNSVAGGSIRVFCPVSGQWWTDGQVGTWTVQ